MSPADRPVQQRSSTAAVLEFAWEAHGFRADHVMAALGLTRSTALAALDALKGKRLGRPARRFELRAEAGLVIGIDAGGRTFTAVAANLAGEVVARQQLDVIDSSVRESPDPAERRSAAFRIIDAVLAAAGRGREDVIGGAVGVPAPVDRDGVSPPNPSGFWHYMNADLDAALHQEFPVVRVENDAALAALAESALGAAQGHDHFVAMLSGRRLGSGVFLDGRLVRGAHGGVGELEGLTQVVDVGGTWGLGELAETWVRAELDSGRVPAGHPWAVLTDAGITAESVLAEARLSDPVARRLIEELGGTLGRICTAMARFYDPEVIVICGAMAGAVTEVIDIASAHVADELELPPPAIVASTLGGDVVALGAVSAAREAAREIVLPLLSQRLQEEVSLA